MPMPTETRIDVHTHYLPPKYLDMLRAGGGVVMGQPHDPGLLNKLIAGQNDAGVRLQILSTGPHSPYLVDEATSTACAREINDVYFDAVKTHDGRFDAFGSVPLPHVTAATAEACRCLDELQFAGLHLGCSIRGKALDDASFDPFWHELNERDTLVFVHPGGILLGTEPGLAGMNDPMLAVVIGSAAETAVATIRLIGLRSRFPRLRFIIAILGGVLPYMYERLAYAAPIFGKGVVGRYTARPLLEELREFYYDTTLDDDVEVLVKARTVFGADRLLLGSDAPTKPPVKSIAFVESANFTPDDLRGILGGNAERLLT